MGAWNHWLPSAYLLADTHPTLGQARLLGWDLINLTLPVSGSPESPSQELPFHHQWVRQCLRCRDTCSQAIV